MKEEEDPSNNRVHNLLNKRLKKERDIIDLEEQSSPSIQVMPQKSPTIDQRDIFYQRLRNELHHHFMKEKSASKMETPFEQTTLFVHEPQSFYGTKDLKAELEAIYQQQMKQNSTPIFQKTIAFLKDNQIQITSVKEKSKDLTLDESAILRSIVGKKYYQTNEAQNSSKPKRLLIMFLSLDQQMKFNLLNSKQVRLISLQHRSNFQNFQVLIQIYQLNTQKNGNFKAKFKYHDKQESMRVEYTSQRGEEAIMVVSRLGQNSRQTTTMIQNYGLFKSISCLCSTYLVKHTKEMMNWLQAFSSIYNYIVDEQMFNHPLNDYLQKLKNKTEVLYFLFFFYSIHQEKSLDKIMELQLIQTLIKNKVQDLEIGIGSFSTYKFFRPISIFYNEFLYEFLRVTRKAFLKPQVVHQLLRLYEPQKMIEFVDKILDDETKTIAKNQDHIFTVFCNQKDLDFQVYFKISQKIINYLGSSNYNFENYISNYFKRIKLVCQNRNHPIDLPEQLESMLAQLLFNKYQQNAFRLSYANWNKWYTCLKEISQFNPEFTQRTVQLLVSQQMVEDLKKNASKYFKQVFLSFLAKPQSRLDKVMLEQIMKDDKFEINVESMHILVNQIMDGAEMESILNITQARQVLLHFVKIKRTLIPQLLTNINQVMETYSHVNPKGIKTSMLMKLFDDIVAHAPIAEYCKDNPTKMKKYFQLIKDLTSKSLAKYYVTLLFKKLSQNGLHLVNVCELIETCYTSELETKTKQAILNVAIGQMGTDKKQVQQTFFGFLKKKGRSFLDFVGTKFTGYQDQINNLFQRIDKNQITISELKSIRQQHQENKKAFESISQNSKSIINCVQRYESKLKRLGVQRNIFSLKQSVFSSEIQYVSQLIQLPQDINISRLFDTNRDLEKVEQNSEKILVLCQHPLWNMDAVEDIPSLMKVFQQLNTHLVAKCAQLCNIQAKYKDYIDFFNVKNIIGVINHICPQQYREKLYNFMAKLERQGLKNLNEYVDAIIYVAGRINCKDVDVNFTKFKEVFEKINNHDEDLIGRQALTQIQLAQERVGKMFNQDMRSKKTKVLSKDEICKVVLNIYQGRKMYEDLQEKKIDLNSINDLREYINDIEHCILKFENIREFQNVLKFIDIIKKSKTFKKFLKDTEALLKKNTSLSSQIENCRHIYISILQKIDEASNRETSFKNQIQAIFKDSTFTINERLQISIRFMMEGIVSAQESNKGQKGDRRKKAKRQSIKKQVQIGFKQLNNFMEKSILLINDIQRQQNQDNIMDNLIKIFKSYCDFFKVIEDIKNKSERLIHYGYNPERLRHQFLIKNGQYNDIIKFKDELNRETDLWIQEIKTKYESSFILTHFIGNKLVQFINSCKDKRYSTSLQRIINLTEEQFNTIIVELDERQIKYENDLEMIETVIEIFKPVQEGYLKLDEVLCKRQHDMMDERIGRKKLRQPEITPINLITCAEGEFYYCLYEKDYEQLLRPTQVFYCQKGTFFEEIEFFIYRAIINIHKPYFIIGISHLKQQVKLQVCDLLNGLYSNRRWDAQKARLNFIDNVVSDKVYSFITQSRIISATRKKLDQNEVRIRTQLLLATISNTLLVESRIAGLGKTFTIQNMARQKKEELVYFSIAGNIKLESIVRRLKKINFNQNTALLIQIGHVENKDILQIFLSQIILFRCIYYKEYIFLPEHASIYIQIENFYGEQTMDMYHILSILKNSKKHYHFIERFQVDRIKLDPNGFDQKFTMVYLNFLDQKNYINQNQFSYRRDYQPKKMQIKYPANYRNLINKHFASQFHQGQGEPTYIIYRAFLKLLFQQFRAFSDSIFFKLHHINQNHETFPIFCLDLVRQNFLFICIDNTLEFLKQTARTNDFNHDDKVRHSFSQKISSFPMLILPSHDDQGFSFIYLTEKSVKFPIKSLILSQNQRYYKQIRNIRNAGEVNDLFKNTAIYNLEQEKKMEFIVNTLFEISGNKKLLNPNQIQARMKQYKLTLDNFFKMCLISYRAKSKVPCIIMGQSGVGKTALIRFLAEVINEQKLFVFNIHAGVHQQQLAVWIDQIIKQSEQAVFHQKNVWVFFDQFNTTDQLSYIKEIIIDRRFQGTPLPENITFLAACNPYRKKTESQGRINAGIKKVQVETRNNDLAFKVHPPNYSMIALMWDYQQLNEKELGQYIQRMIEDIKFQDQKKLIKMLIQTHQIFKRKIELSSVSLRDVSRFTKLYKWFKDNRPQSHEDRQLYKLNSQEDGPDNMRSMVLAYIFCYAQRYSTFVQRKVLIEHAEKMLGFSKRFMFGILQREQASYISQFKSQDEKIAFNSALMDNLFTSFVCIQNKIPILIIGNPGSSKSLSIRMLCSSLRGQSSHSNFCKKYPLINMIYFQGSQSCTSQGVQQVFQKAKKIKNDYQKADWKMDTCIYFDEIGLAEKSVHNPLKVLHSKLESRDEISSFIGISNWELDCAKMSRFMIVAHANPSETDVEDTAAKIYESYIEDDKTYLELFQKLGKFYYRFVQQWNHNKNNREGYFGLRDFYCYIKYICQEIKDTKLSGQRANMQELIERSIQINFDGEKNSLNVFHRIIGSDNISYHMNPIELVKKNLQDTESRCLLLIIKGDALIPIINNSIQVNGKTRKVVCIYGSTFKLDQQSEDYNLKMTSAIIAHISRGDILTFKDINNSIQTSLYDLFNKSFTRIMNKRYCRIAVGANSNPKCFVHNDFNAIVYVDQDKLKQLDLPFLNRFQKHYLNLSSMINEEQIQLLKEILKWVDNLLIFASKFILKRENYLINSSEESIVTLIIKYRGEHNNRRNLIKGALLLNMTTDFGIALRLYPQIQEEFEIKRYLQKLIPPGMCERDMIVFTYDQLSHLIQRETIFGNVEIIRLGQINNEKIFEDKLIAAFKNTRTNKVEIKLNYQLHYMHVNYVLFKCKQMKGNFDHKQLIITIQLHRHHFNRFKVDYINISYLHQYQQYFVENLDDGNNLQEIINANDLLSLYQILKCQEEFSNNVINTVKSIRLQVSKLTNQNNRIIQAYFNICMGLSTNQRFEQCCVQLFQAYFPMRTLNLLELLSNREDVLNCSNIEQAVAYNINPKIISIIYYLMKGIIQNDLLFYFIEENPDSLDEQMMTFFQFYMEGNACTHQIYKIQLDKLMKDMMNRMNALLQANNYKRVIETNPLKVPPTPSIIPRLGQLLKSIFKQDNSKQNELLLQIKGPKEKQVYGIDFLHNRISSQHLEMFTVYEDSHIFKKVFYNDLISQMLQFKSQKGQIDNIIAILISALRELSLMEAILVFGQNKEVLAQLLGLIDAVHSPEVIHKIQPIGRMNNLNDIPIRLLQDVVHASCELIHLNHQNIKREDSIQGYLQLFKDASLKIREIINTFTEAAKFDIPNEFYGNYSFMEMIQSLKQDKKVIISSFLSMKEDCSFYKKVYLMLADSLANEQDSNTRDIILNSLSLNIFTEWLESVKSETSIYAGQIKQCVEAFINIANQFALFANNSAYFISMLLEDNPPDNMDNFQQFMKNYHEIGLIREEDLEVNNNFTVAVSNFIFSQIKGISERGDMEIQDFYLIIIREYLDMFKRVSDHQQTGIYYLFKIEFMKYYLSYYVQLLLKDIEIELQQEVDKILCRQNEVVRHLRIYLFKHIYGRYGQNMQEISQQFIKIKRCKWILKLEEFIKGHEQEQYLPPRIISQDDHYYQSLISANDKNYENSQFLKNIVIQGLRSPQRTYELLGHFVHNFYFNPKTKTVQERIRKTLSQIKNEENSLVINLLTNYVIQQKLVFFGQKKNHNPMDNLPYLNYLNIMVSLRNIPCCFLEMVFDKKGQPDRLLSQKFQNSFLIGSLKNPALQRIKFILEKHRQKLSGSSYLKCSDNCDYVAPIGGNFYGPHDGCQNPISFTTCPFCGQTIGARQYNVLLNKSGKVIQAKRVHELIPKILPKKDVKLIYQTQEVNYSLIGYSLGNSIDELMQSIQMKRHFKNAVCDFILRQNKLIYHFILQSIINFTWGYLLSTTAIPSNEFNKFLGFKGIDANKAKIFFSQAAQFNFEQLNQILNFTDQKQTVLWHLGVGKLLFKYIQSYPEKHKQFSNLPLSDPQASHHFETDIDRYLFPYYQLQKQKLINDSLNIKKINSIDIITQRGNVQKYSQKYPLIRLFKLEKMELSPSLENMRQFYQETLAKYYPLLHYLVSSPDIDKNIQDYKIIIHFITLVRKTYNFKITRQEANRQIRYFFENDNNLRGRVDLQQFINAWNVQSNNLKSVQEQCANLEFIETVTDRFPLNNFLLDSIHKDNRQSRLLLGFLKAIALVYNSMCKKVEDLVALSYPNQNANISSNYSINPTIFDQQGGYFKFPIEQIKERIQQNASFTVEYGIYQPHYPFDQIQSKILKELYGFKYMIQDGQKYNYMNYIGEQIVFVHELKDDEKQFSFDENGLAFKKINELVKHLKMNDSERYHKILKRILGSLQIIMIYFKKERQTEDIYNLTIGNFIQRKKIPNMPKQLIEDPLKSVPLFNLVNLYEIIEDQSYEKVELMLDLVYKQPLQDVQKREVLQLVERMKKGDTKRELPPYEHFKKAVYRLIGRNLVFLQGNEKSSLADYLCNLSYYWPKGTNYESEVFSSVLSKIKLSQIVDLLRYVPFKDVAIEKEVKMREPERAIVNMEKKGMQKMQNKRYKL